MRRGLHGRRGRGRDLPRRDRAGPHGGGHRQVAPRRRHHRPDPRRRLTRWSTTTAPASRWSRSSPSRWPAPARGAARSRGPTRSCASCSSGSASSDVRMEQGSLRCDVNLSLPPKGATELGTRTETKNVNSLRSVERAVALRDRAAAGRPRRRRHDPPGDASLARGHRHHDAGARSPRPRTTATSPSPTWCRWRRAASGWRSCAAGCRSRRTSGARRLQEEWGFSDLEMQRHPSAGALDLGGGRRSRRSDPAAARKWWLGELARRANEPRPRARPSLGVTPADVARVQALVDEGTLNDKLARAGARRRAAGEGTPDEVVATGPRRSSATRASWARRSMRPSPPIPTSRTRSATARWRRRAPSSAR